MSMSKSSPAKAGHKKIPSQVVNLGTVSLFNDIASEMLYPVMPIFITQILKAPVAVVGIIEGVAEGTSSIFKTFFGYWSDKLQKRKPFVTGGYAASAIAKIIIAVSYTWPVVFLGRFIDRLGKGIRTASRDALLLEYSHKKNRGLIFGFHRSMDSAGAVIGPIIALILLSLFKSNIRLILYIAAIPSLFALIFLMFIKEKKKQPISKKLSLVFSFKNISPKFKYFLVIISLFTLGNSSDAFLILRAKGLGMTITTVIAVYIVYNLVYTLFSTPAGNIADKIGPKKVFLFGVLIYSFVYLGFAFNKNLIFVWILFAIYGVYIAFTDGISKTLVAEYITKNEAGTAYGILQTIISLFTLLASVIGGFLWSVFSPAATFIFGSICALVAFTLFLIGRKY